VDDDDTDNSKSGKYEPLSPMLRPTSFAEDKKVSF
jgi:hypothetical protein